MNVIGMIIGLLLKSQNNDKIFTKMNLNFSFLVFENSSYDVAISLPLLKQSKIPMKKKLKQVLKKIKLIFKGKKTLKCDNKNKEIHS